MLLVLGFPVGNALPVNTVCAALWGGEELDELRTEGSSLLLTLSLTHSFSSA